MVLPDVSKKMFRVREFREKTSPTDFRSAANVVRPEECCCRNWLELLTEEGAR